MASPGFDNKVVGVVPVGQQVAGVLVVNAYVVIGKDAREEVVNLSRHVQDVADAEKQQAKKFNRLFYSV